MDETIGSRGGHNDRRRSLIITKNQKKKLRQYQKERELRELEKEVKKKQIYTLIKALPIAIGGETVRTIHDTATGTKRIDKEEEYSKWRIKEYDADFTTRARGEEANKTRKIVVTKDGQKIIVRVPIEETEIVNEPTKKDPFVVTEENKKQVEVKKTDRFQIVDSPKKEVTENKKGIADSQVKEIIKDKENIIENSIDNHHTSSINDLFEDLSPLGRDRLEKLKSRKIIDEYEKQLKDIRYELKELIFDYNVLVGEQEDAITSKELENILDRLNALIMKIEKLKDKIQVDNLDKYDDNYIYTLIEDYISEFKDGNAVEEIKDSPLYVLISKKLDELDTKKDELEDKVTTKKELLEIQEEDFQKLKEKYYNVDKLNKDLEEFQKEQEILLKEVREKVKNAVTVSERVEVQFQAMNRQSRRLLRMMMASMFFPGPRAARRAAASTASYLYFMRNILNPPTTTKKYKVITVQDYSSDIEYSINSIRDAIDLLSKTGKQVDKMISQIKEDFKDYLGVLRECDELLSNLEKIKSEIKEKEYEMEKIKSQQEKELEKNNAKVLTRGEYPM